MSVTQVAGPYIKDNAVDGANISLASEAAGDIMYYNGTDWIRLAKGTADQVLTMNDGATAPGWEAASAGATLSGSTDDTIVTVTGANAMAGEANLKFDGTNFGIGSGMSLNHAFVMHQTGTDDEDGMAFQNSANNHHMRIKLDSSNYFVMSNGGNGGVLIDTTGKVAIGQSSSVAPLQVHKETAVSSPYGTFAITSRDNLSGANGNFGMVWQQVNASNAVQTTRGSLYFSNTRNEMTVTGHSGAAFTIESTGGGILNLKNTSTDAATGTSFIRFQGSANAQNGYVGFGSSNGQFHINSSGNNDMKFYTNGGLRLTISSTGTFSGSSSNDISDKRIKENIEDTGVGLAEILQLRPVKFNFQSGKGWGKEGQKFYGLLAQEVEAVIPEAVHTDDIDIDEVFEADIPRDIDGERLLDENGQLIEGLKRDLNGVSDLKSVGMSQITTALIKAVQELNAKVDALGVDNA